ncbi:phosphoethanolamine transferase [Mixta tenebrionis]|nr:phosphoethanolamine transferase [Mixta tenebrionis]
MKFISHLRNFLVVLYPSILLNYAMGYGGAKGIDIIFIALFLVTISLYPLLRLIILVPLFALIAIYSPTGYLYGPPSLSIIAALLQTNKKECIEFLYSVPYICYALPALVVSSWLLLKKNIFKFHYRSYIKYFLTVLLVIFIGVLSFTGRLEKIKIINFFISINNSTATYLQQIKKLSEGNVNAQWQIAETDNHYANIVVIIGESMRADYMSVFGYPLPTTPFLSQANGTFYRNYISTAPNTFLSLPRALSLSDGENFDISHNFVNLAKQAGFETFWISNQGMLGDFDLPTSKLAMYSDHKIFLKKGDYASSDIDDVALLPHLQAILAAKDTGKRVIILHLMGSHPQFKKRLHGKKPYFHYANEDISDYISTYRNTDSLIGSAYTMLKQTGQPFKLFYFSDHGLSKRTIGNAVYLRHSSATKQNYHVPLLMLSDDARERKYVDKAVSAFNFISFFAGETGIKVIAPKLQSWDDNANEVQVFNGKTMVPYHSLAEDPAVIPE